ncbi:MAG: ABC transporter ATP-binding protein/permease [Actinomycetota bacterium]|nr:ABC transporter ATP-binding protein/permease [Actinomycetota bacterium]
MFSKLDRALLATYLRPEWPRAALLALLLFAGIGLQLANPQIASFFIDQALAGEPFERLVRIALLFIGVVLLAQVATIAETFVAEDLGWRTTNALRVDLTRRVLNLDASFHAKHGPGEMIERIDGDVSAIADFFSRFIVQVLGSVVFLLGVLVLLYREDWRVGALLTLFAGAAFVFMTRGGSFVGVRSRAARESAAELSDYLEERLGGLPDIKASGADAYAMRGLHERMAARFHSGRSSIMAGSYFYSFVGLLFVLGTGAVLILSTTLHGAGAITLGTVYLVFRYTGMLRLPLERLALHMNSFQQATGGIIRVRELLATQARVVDGPGATFPDGALSVELDGVSFAYEDEPVLRGVSFCIAPCEVLGVLGRTGSGKTTISRLLFRLHDPTDGVVRLGGADVRNARLAELRARIGLVTQDVQLFEGTLRDNVTLFDRAVPDARLREVFPELGLEEWLDDLQAGLDTPLGATGRGLSAGEAQLVALARVFLRDPGLVVLDEASSRLDPATERLIERAVTRLLDGRTGVVIAHRLETVERADKILILEDGSIAELGARTNLAIDPGSQFARLLRSGIKEQLV